MYLSKGLLSTAPIITIHSSYPIFNSKSPFETQILVIPVLTMAQFPVVLRLKTTVPLKAQHNLFQTEHALCVLL